MPLSKPLGVHGIGHMSLAMLTRLMSVDLINPKNVAAFDPNPIPNTLRYQSLSSNFAVAQATSTQMLVVKPDMIRRVSQSIAPALYAKLFDHHEPSLIMSAAARVSCEEIQDGLALGQWPIIHFMPNLPVELGKGMIVYRANEYVSPQQLELAEQLFACMGDFLRVDSEEKISMATAVSGSGPAYDYYVEECRVDAAINIGFTEDEARRLVRGTSRGANAMLDAHKGDAITLRKNVTSPGGTTAAAMTEFEKGGVFKQIVADATYAAYQSAKQNSPVPSNQTPGLNIFPPKSDNDTDTNSLTSGAEARDCHRF